MYLASVCSGAYNVDSNIGKGTVAASMKGRYDVKDNMAVPGPGAYEIKSPTGEAPKYSMRIRPDDSKQFVGPGPGEYDVKGTVGSVPGKTMSSRYETKDSQLTPGPGSYNSEEKGAAPKYTMRSRTAPPSAFMNPGPGAYEVKGAVGSAPKYTMSSRYDTKDASQAPGPGAYNPNSNNQGPSYSMSGIRKATNDGNNISCLFSLLLPLSCCFAVSTCVPC